MARRFDQLGASVATHPAILACQDFRMQFLVGVGMRPVFPNMLDTDATRTEQPSFSSGGEVDDDEWALFEVQRSKVSFGCSS